MDYSNIQSFRFEASMSATILSILQNLRFLLKILEQTCVTDPCIRLLLIMSAMVLRLGRVGITAVKAYSSGMVVNPKLSIRAITSGDFLCFLERKQMMKTRSVLTMVWKRVSNSF